MEHAVAEQFARLKQVLGAFEDKQVTEALDLSPSAYSDRKRRGAFPEDKVLALAVRRPDLQIDVHYVLTGERLTARQRAMTEAALAATEQADLDDATKRELRETLTRAQQNLATLNAQRKGRYEVLNELLNDCSDETLELVMQAVVRFRAADLAGRER